MKKNILMIFGGKSSEHDISIVSAFQCLKSFDEYLYSVYCVYIDQNGVWRYFKDKTLKEFMEQRNNFPVCQLGVNENVFYILKGGKYKKLTTIDVVVPIMHGINGEDGCISGLLNMCNIPYVGSDNISSAIGIDKYLFKKMCGHLPILPYEVCGFEDIVDDADFVNNISKKVGFPCIVKPCRQGSSIGVNICRNKENLINSIKKSLNYDKNVILEKFVDNMREFNIAVLSSGGELIVSEIEEPISGQNILTFEDKYLNFSGAQVSKKMPAPISASLKNKIVDLAKECYLTCGFSGVVRIDFIYDKESKILYINEANTMPGAMSLYLFEGGGLERKEVLNTLIREAIRRHNEDSNNSNLFKSEILNRLNVGKFNK